MTTVVIADTRAGIEPALDEVFAAFGGVGGAIPADGRPVYVKPNAVHLTPYAHTDPAVLDALLAYLHDRGYRRLAVMESCTGGNFTRLVFHVIGYDRICRRYGARAIYLDEGPTLEVALRDGSRAHVSKHLHDEVVRRGDGAFYLSLPKLKTHSMTTVTLGVKNQQAFPVHGDRMAYHNHDTLHLRLAALYDLVRPDFCIVEGLTATAHGHFPLRAHLGEQLVPVDVLVGGADTLAVDVVAARLLGYSIDEVEHLRLCAGWGLGEGDLDRIDVRGARLDRLATRVPHTLLRRFHPGVRWVVGRQKACAEGCRGNSEALQEMFYGDYPQARGGWTLMCGSGFEDGDLDDLPGDLLVVGPCACSEVGDALRRRYPGRRIYLVPEHNDLMAITRCQARLMGVRPLDMVPANPLVAVWTLLQARLHGLNARVPPAFG
ncbi:MAG TPA: DUF362 domain-containing protein [Anaerolineae bacterium]|nr:DUF362 domain-containing protein [Anaerolineae bacterium]